MTDIEDRLRDAFAALDRTIEVPARLEARHRSPWRAPLLAVVGAAAALVVVVSVWSMSPAEDPETTVSSDPADRTFEQVAGPLCAGLLPRLGGTAPRFATLDAFRVAAEQRVEVIRSVLPSLAAAPEAVGDARLKGRVIDAFEEAVARAEIVLDRVDDGDLDAAATAWPRVDRYIDLARGLLADRGVEACR